MKLSVTNEIDDALEILPLLFPVMILGCWRRLFIAATLPASPSRAQHPLHIAHVLLPGRQHSGLADVLHFGVHDHTGAYAMR